MFFDNISTDASQEAVGEVLQEGIQDELRPLAFFSQRLQPAQTRYGTSGREFIAAYQAVTPLQFFLEGRDLPYSPTISRSPTPGIQI